jgi:hypothetical protein
MCDRERLRFSNTDQQALNRFRSLQKVIDYKIWNYRSTGLRRLSIPGADEDGRRTEGLAQLDIRRLVSNYITVLRCKIQLAGRLS